MDKNNEINEKDCSQSQDMEMSASPPKETRGTHHVELTDHMSSFEAAKVEKRLVLKQDLTVVPLLCGCVFLAFLDLSAMGNAAVMGFQADLHLTAHQFFNCLMVIFVGYMVFELPAALAVRFFQPNYVYGSAVISFGVFAACMSAARSYGSVIALRLLLGFGESFVQTGFVFLSLWYTKNELTTRCALFFASSPFAGAFSGLIAYASLRNLNGHLGKAAWEWYFIIEGCITICWGLLILAFLPKLPETVVKSGSWLFRGEAEHAILARRILASGNTPNEKPRAFQILLALKDPKTWLGAMIIAGCGLNIAAFSSFLPTFINEFGFPALRTQLMSIIPYAFAMVTLPTASILADKWQKRAAPTMICITVAVIGYVLLLATTNKVALVAGCCFIAAGAYPGFVISVSWQMSTHAGFTKRATAWAISQIALQMYSIISTQIYTKPPRYFTGHGVVLGLNALALLACAVNYLLMKTANTKRDEIAADHERNGTEDPYMGKSLEELCDQHPKHRYVL